MYADTKRKKQANSQPSFTTATYNNIIVLLYYYQDDELQPSYQISQ